ncbi:reverse transcriptase [Caerostris darwini]|uniref:Reverse transcriptase n=1 Tax=Caerostris darwini TaxID=1538125 RepID=A0AAV4UFY5_9ARAC|nr:reverse transcriptase [Caerostris darwini]
MSRTTKSFLLALRRFLSRRGVCQNRYSDNAKSFKAAERELQHFAKIVKEQELKDFLSSQGVTWKFIIERAPWWEGFYGRLGKCVKDPLRKILESALLTFEEVSTILTEIEAVINMRPLTYTTNDLRETEPLTPAQFLHFGKTEFSYPLHFADLVTKISTKETLLRRKRYQTNLLKQVRIKRKERFDLDKKIKWIILSFKPQTPFFLILNKILTAKSSPVKEDRSKVPIPISNPFDELEKNNVDKMDTSEWIHLIPNLPQLW